MAPSSSNPGKKRGRPSKYILEDQKKAQYAQKRRNQRQTAVAEERAIQFNQFYSPFPSTEVNPIITPSISYLSTVADPPIAHLTGMGEPSVTHALEELLPLLSPGLAPTELEDDHLHIDESPLGRNSFEAAARLEPEISIRQSIPTRSTGPHVDDQSNLETRGPTSPIPEPCEDICTLARLLADQLYQHHGCCNNCHEQAHTEHQETHPVHTGLRDYVD
jgi:hypothetical protein